MYLHQIMLALSNYSKMKGFCHVLYENKNVSEELGIYILCEPIVEKSDSGKEFDRLMHLGYYYIGLSSFLTFPDTCVDEPTLTNPFFNFKTTGNLVGWLHCSREVSKTTIPKTIPTLLWSESDISTTHTRYNPSISKKYDVIYNCQKGVHQKIWRNWKFGFECLKIMVYTYDLKVVLVGKKGEEKTTPEEDLFFQHKNVFLTDFLKYDIMIQYIQESKILFVPNILDASPRVAAEALSLNIPVLENRNIVGGWKYINKHTGCDFESIGDFEKALQYVMNNKTLTPRKWFLDNYTHKNASKPLIDFMYSLKKPLFMNCFSIFEYIDCIVCSDYNHRFSQFRLSVYDENNYKNIQTEKYVLFLHNEESLYNSKMSDLCHFMNLFLQYKKEKSEILFLSGNCTNPAKSEYLYLNIAYDIRNISAFIVSGKTLKKYYDFIDKKINTVPIKTPYILKNDIVKPCKSDGWALRSKYSKLTKVKLNSL